MNNNTTTRVSRLANLPKPGTLQYARWIVLAYLKQQGVKIPYAIGIEKQLVSKLVNLNPKLIQIVIGELTRSKPYLQATADAHTRHGLPGAQGGLKLLDKHKAHAQQKLGIGGKIK